MKSTTSLLPLCAAFSLATSAVWAAPTAPVSGAAHAVKSTVRSTTAAVGRTAAGVSGNAVVAGQAGMANASAALASGGNPAAAIGASSFTPTVSGSAIGRSSANGALTAPGTTANGTALGINSGATVSNDLAFTDAESIGMRRERARREAEARASLGAQGSAAGIAGAATADFDATPTSRAIRQSSVDSRDQLADRIDDQIDAGRQAVKTAKKEARELKGDVQDRFDAAREEVAARESQLKQSARAARQASADTWGQARAQLAADYAAYADAVKRAQLAVDTDVSGSGSMALSDGGRSIDTTTAGTARAALDARATAESIRSSSFAARDQLATTVEQRMTRGHEVVETARTDRRELGERARAELKDATTTVAARERQLKTSLRAAQLATEDTWSDARDRLADSYRAYAEAVNDVQADASSQTDVSATGVRPASSVSDNLAASADHP